jgi:hypothetical protein
MTSNTTRPALRTSTEPTTERTTPSPIRSARMGGPKQSPSKLPSSLSEHDADSAAGPAKKMTARNPIPPNDPNTTAALTSRSASASAASASAASAASASATSVEYGPSYSYGKRVNIITGREPRLPRALVEGRHSDRMVELKGRTYNAEDWIDDGKQPKDKVTRGRAEDAAKGNPRK